MMNKYILYTVIFTISILPSYSQNYRWVPNEIVRAVKNGTRTGNGLPGQKYWQNHADYSIKARLITGESALEGEERVVYFNNSPDTLRKLVIRLYQDFYKKGSARSWSIGPDDITNGMKITDFTINGKKEKFPQTFGRYHYGTNHTVRLKTPLLPSDSVILTFKWKFHVPQITRNRMGNYGKGRYFIAYWYPQIAVYDDVSGWDNIEFEGIVEFYNDFNNYDVNITVPDGYTVWATGHLTNERELFSPEIVRRINMAGKSDEIVNVITRQDWKNRRVLKNNSDNTWHFKAKNISDFSFAAMPMYNWDASSVMVDSSSRRRVIVSAVYPDSSNTFEKAALYARNSIIFMSHKLPGYPYPFEHMTSVSNGTPYGGMETPMMANDGDPKDTASLLGLIFHEISHSYFPFFMGTNEKKYAWMDEGWATYLTGMFVTESIPEYDYFGRRAKSFSKSNGNEMEVPLMYPSNLIADFPYYRTHAYGRSALAYMFLHKAMGDSLFKKALNDYITIWHGKHPGPYDFFNIFNSVSHDDLSWFINPWFFDKATADLSIKKVTNKGQIVIENRGGLPLPVKVTCIYTDGSNDTFYKPVSVWKQGYKAVVIQADSSKTIISAYVGSGDIPDINKSNNRFELEP
jgi:hypothetical protein